MIRNSLIVFLCLAASVSHAQDSSAYRLKLEHSEAFRVQTFSHRRPPQHTDVQSPLLAGKPYADEIAAAAREVGLDAALVHAVIHVESAYRANAVSGKGALGLMQIMPETAQRFGIPDATAPRANLMAGTRYLRALLDQFDQRTELALAAYNAGEGAILRHGGAIPPYPETQRYVPAVLGKYNEWRNPTLTRIDYSAGTRIEHSGPNNVPSRSLPSRSHLRKM